MQFNGEAVLTSILSQGMLLSFAPGTLFGPDKWHYAVVVNKSPVEGRLVIVACATSKYKKRKDMAVMRGEKPSTVVHLPKNVHPKFSEGLTGFDCNYVKKIDLVELIYLFECRKVKLVRNDGDLDQKYVDQIITGILESKIVPANIQDIFI